MCRGLRAWDREPGLAETLLCSLRVRQHRCMRHGPQNA